MRTTLASIVLSSALAASVPATAQPEPATPTILETMQREADALAPTVGSDLARAFLKQAAGLPVIPPRTLWRDKATRRQWLTNEQAASLAEAERAELEELTINDTIYYTTKYGSPLAYVRAIDVLASHGVTSLERKRVLDYGYGTVGHLRMMASMGATAVGVDVDPFLAALYGQPSDQGAVPRAGGEPGRVALIHGRWPAEQDTNLAVARNGPYDVFISKNTLKKGYVTPDAPRDEIDPRMLIDLGVEPDDYLAALRGTVVPGGVVIIYNLCPAHPEGKYSPMADGRSPWTREQWAEAGFEVLAFDIEDHAAARRMGSALGWDTGPRPMDLENSLFAWYTVVRASMKGGETEQPTPPAPGERMGK